jgi:aryl-alcohol dehydrogenase-like predicted oxidoreductase
VQYIKLGTTGLDVSPIAIGAMTYGDPTAATRSGRWTRRPAAH